jgi:hypothetical protein
LGVFEGENGQAVQLVCGLLGVGVSIRNEVDLREIEKGREGAEAAQEFYGFAFDVRIPL